MGQGALTSRTPLITTTNTRPPRDRMRNWGQPAMALLLGLLSGCASVAQPVSAPATGMAQAAPAPAPAAFSTAANTPIPQGADQDLARLFALWKERTSNLSSEFPIGPGDILQVSVPTVDELKDRSFRVEGDNTIALPLIGVVQVGGLTEAQVRQQLIKKLQRYMYNPQVDVFVKEYRSRQAAVEGAVRYPGLITVAGPTDTILDMLSRAGGRTAEAADQVILIPSALNSLSIAALSDVSNTTGKRNLPLPFLAGADPIMIPVGSVNLGGSENYLNLPVRPGDVILVPGGGEVAVTGWVVSPGHLKVVSGLTVMGAIGATGGPMFAANESKVRLYRSLKDGSRVVIPIDLYKIKSGQEADPAVLANDVISVPYSDVKIGPYVIYNVVSRLGYGVAIPTP